MTAPDMSLSWVRSRVVSSDKEFVCLGQEIPDGGGAAQDGEAAGPEHPEVPEISLLEGSAARVSALEVGGR
jgi:hypothetical protein